MLTLIATGSNINTYQIQVGDVISGYYMGRYPFQAKFIANRSRPIAHCGRYSIIEELEVELMTDCERPQNGLFNAGEKILLILSGKLATELLTHSR